MSYNIELELYYHCLLSKIVMHMPLNAWTKFLFNKLLLLDLWLGHEWIDFIVQVT